MIIQFINREKELEFLEEAFNEKKAGLIIIYGRRRVGKTELITQFMKNHKGIYLLATQDVEKEILYDFSIKIGNFFNDKALILSPFSRFSQVLEYLTEKVKDRKEKVVVSIDEFPYLVNANKAIPSLIQKYWDMHFRHHNVFFILSGSSIGFMESMLGEKSPLFGRRTAQWKVEQFKFASGREFFPGLPIEKQIEFYSVLGGMPAYLKEFDEREDLTENILNKIAAKGKVLYDEVEFILKTELREPKVYFSILKEIAKGKNRLNEISNALGMERTNLTQYIQTLESLDITESIYPITIDKPKTRKVRHHIKDNFFDFWFKFVYPLKSDLEIGRYENFINCLEKELNSFIGRKFEGICREFLIEKMPMNFTKIGKWWGFYRDKNNKRNDLEVDLVVLDENKKEIAFFECKWKKLTYNQSLKLLEELKEKSGYVKWFNKQRKEQYGIIAKKIENKEDLRKKGFLVYDLDDWK